MEVNIINGDVLKSGSPIIAHQVNCMGIMGGGVALQVKKKYPEVFNKYLNLVESTSDKLALLGTAQFVECGYREVVRCYRSSYS
jgi:O-acetyl-ADP-ribose deacetylase (regulator of RNase III)